MIAYNTTIIIQHPAHANWLAWMEHDYIPHVLDSGMVDRYQLSRLLGVDETEGITYSLQLFFSSKPAYDLYQENYAFQHQHRHDDKFKGQFLSFRSTMNVVLYGG
ncbi:MAG: DUF4286 family protein [Saprospiraceae bacterium]